MELTSGSSSEGIRSSDPRLVSSPLRVVLLAAISPGGEHLDAGSSSRLAWCLVLHSNYDDNVDALRAAFNPTPSGHPVGGKAKGVNLPVESSEFDEELVKLLLDVEKVTIVEVDPNDNDVLEVVNDD